MAPHTAEDSLDHTGHSLASVHPTPGTTPGDIVDMENKLATAQRFSQLSWAHSEESCNNLRSDFFTKPTLPMLEAICTTSLGDGDMDEDPTTNDFQSYVNKRKLPLITYLLKLLIPPFKRKGSNYKAIIIITL